MNVCILIILLYFQARFLTVDEANLDALSFQSAVNLVKECIDLHATGNETEHEKLKQKINEDFTQNFGCRQRI